MTPEQHAEMVAEVFARIHREQMADIPILNPRLEVECLGFQEYQGRAIGILITPWLMNLLMLRREKRLEHWAAIQLEIERARHIQTYVGKSSYQVRTLSTLRSRVTCKTC